MRMFRKCRNVFLVSTMYFAGYKNGKRTNQMKIRITFLEYLIVMLKVCYHHKEHNIKFFLKLQHFLNENTMKFSHKVYSFIFYLNYFLKRIKYLFFGKSYKKSKHYKMPVFYSKITSKYLIFEGYFFNVSHCF